MGDNNNDNSSRDQYMERRRSQLTDMRSSNADNYWEFYQEYYDTMTNEPTTDQISSSKNNLEKLQKKLKEETKNIGIAHQEFAQYTNDTIGKREFVQQKVQKARTLRTNGNPNNPTIIGQYENDTRPYLNISSIYNDIKYEPDKYKKEFEKIEDMFNNDYKINANVFDWKSLDPLQDNIGSVKSLVEFFFNFMMCYHSDLIKCEEEHRFGTTNLPPNSHGFYLPLPEEWTKDGGILDKMMNTNTDDYKLLKYRGIPIHIDQGYGGIAAEYVRAYIPTKSVNPTMTGGVPTAPTRPTKPLYKVWDTSDSDSRHITTPYITQPMHFYDSTSTQSCNGGNIDEQNWGDYENTIRMGGYFRGFLLKTDQTTNMVEGNTNIPNNTYSIGSDMDSGGMVEMLYIATTSNGGSSGLFGYNSDNNIINYSINDGGYKINGNLNKLNNSDNNVYLSTYFSNIYRTLYDIIYSNPAFITDKENPQYKNSASQWYALGLKGQDVYAGTDINNVAGTVTDIKNVVGGYVNINGSLPGTHHIVMNGQSDTNTIINNTLSNNVAISSVLANPGYHLDFGENAPPYGSNVDVENVLHFRCTNNARTAYNSVLLSQMIKPDFRIDGYIDASDPKSLEYKYLNDRTIHIHVPTYSWTNSGGNKILNSNLNEATNEIMQNLWLANPGGYLGGSVVNGTTGSAETTPTGLLTARYNTSNTASGDLTENFPLPDSIPNDDVIEAVIYKFAKMIFENLNDNYLIDKTKTQIKNNAIKYFAYRLSRSIIIVKDSIFCAPIFEKYGENLESDYKDGNYLKGGKSELNKPARLYKTELGTIKNNAELKERQNSATYCKDSQPLTIALTTMFREAFTRMMNKAILTRHHNREDLSGTNPYFKYEEVKAHIDAITDNTYNNIKADGLVDEKSYIAGCAGRCYYLVKLDVSDILKMHSEDSKFYFMNYLRDCLNTDKNILKYNINFKTNQTFRPCSAGVLQIKNSGNQLLNYEAIKDIDRYLYGTVYLSKLDYLGRLLTIDNTVKKDRNYLLDTRRKNILKEIRPKIDNFINAIANEQIYDAKSKLLLIITDIKKDVSNYKVAYDRFNEKSEILNNLLLKVNQLLENGRDINYDSLNIQISRLYEEKQKNINKFEETYEEIVPKIIITLDEMQKIKERINLLPLSKLKKESLLDKYGTMIDKLYRDVETDIPSIVTNLLNQTEMDKLTNLDPYMEYILKDPELKGGIWVPYITYVKFVIRKYMMVNIFTGEIIEIKSDTDLKRKNIKGKILISTSAKSPHWYYYSGVPDPVKLKGTAKDIIEYLNMYRNDFFKSYGQPGRFDVIRMNFVKKVLYAKGINKNLSDPKVKDADVDTFVAECSEETKPCQGFIYFDDLLKKLLSIVKVEAPHIASKEIYKKVKRDRKPLTGGKKSPKNYSEKVIIL
jgi:hypothetical protein